MGKGTVGPGKTVAETRIYTEEAQSAACRDMLAAGYVALCHGVGPRRGGTEDFAEQEMQLANGI